MSLLATAKGLLTKHRGKIRELADDALDSVLGNGEEIREDTREDTQEDVTDDSLDEG